MGVWEFLTGKAEAGTELAMLLDQELLMDKQERAYLKKLALTTVVEYVANTVAQTTYEVSPPDPGLEYTLSVKPNANQSGAHLLKEITRRMILDGEALLIKTNTDQLLLADDFDRTEFAMLPDMFSRVTVKDFVFDRSFNRDEVFYIPYMNTELKRLVNEMLADYGELFGRVIEQQKRKNQLRASVEIDATVSTDAATQERLQRTVDRIYKRISNSAVALFPEQKGVKYKEHSKETASGSTDGVAEMLRIADGYTEQVARLIGLPPVLLLGSLADTGDAQKSYYQHCVDPIVHTIQGEFNRQMWTREEHQQGKRIKMRRVPGRDIFDLSGAVDKLIGAKMATPNELRVEAGMPRSEKPGMDDFYLTKNYEESPRPAEGGEENAESN